MKPNCPSWQQMLPDYLEKRLSSETQTELEKHLAVCAACRAELTWQQSWLTNVRALQDEAAQTHFSPDLQDRVLTAVRAVAKEAGSAQHEAVERADARWRRPSQRILSRVAGLILIVFLVPLLMHLIPQPARSERRLLEPEVPLAEFAQPREAAAPQDNRVADPAREPAQHEVMHGKSDGQDEPVSKEAASSQVLDPGQPAATDSQHTAAGKMTDRLRDTLFAPFSADSWALWQTGGPPAVDSALAALLAPLREEVAATQPQQDIFLEGLMFYQSASAVCWLTQSHPGTDAVLLLLRVPEASDDASLSEQLDRLQERFPSVQLHLFRLGQDDSTGAGERLIGAARLANWQRQTANVPGEDLAVLFTSPNN